MACGAAPALLNAHPPGPARFARPEQVLERTGHVHFGNDTDDGVMLNQLQGIVLQGQVSNVVQGIPTDCPTREKHGWLGDAASTAEEAMFNFEMQGVFEEFLQTIRDNQDPAGDVPGVVPATSVPPPAWGAGRPEYAAGRESFTIISPVTAGEQWTRDAKTDISWSAAYPLITAWLLKHYNNLRVVERHWPSLVEYMDGLLEAASNQTECGGPCLPTFFKWGDWCAVEARSTATPSTGPILAGFNYIAALDAMVEMGRALGNEGNATRCVQSVSGCQRLAGPRRQAWSDCGALPWLCTRSQLAQR